jgi:cation:H+ antiporter
LAVGLGLVALFVGGELFVRGAGSAGLRMGLSDLFVGLAIVAFGTSAAELAVSVDAALNGVLDIALSNVIGSNIANIALVLGVTALITHLGVDKVSMRRDMPVMLAATVLTLFMLYDDVLSRFEAITLITALIAYLVYAWHTSKRPAEVSDLSDTSPQSRSDTWPVITLFLVTGTVLLAFGSHLLVQGAVGISTMLGISQAVIGLTVVAVGTSLPEIMASTMAAMRGKTDMALGNIVGSNIWNLLAVLGIAGTITDLPRGGVSWDMLGVCLAVSLLLVLVARTGHRITRSEGGSLVVVYVAYQIWLYTLAPA